MGIAALARSRTPALNTVDCSKLSPWLAELGQTRQGCTRCRYPVVEISPPDVIKRRTVLWHGIASSSLTRCAKVEIRCCAPRDLLAVYAQGIGQDGETIVQDCQGQNFAARNRMNTPEKSAHAENSARLLSRTEEARTP